MRVYPDSGGHEPHAILRTFPDVIQSSELDFQDLLLHHLAPGLGCVIAFIMFFSPFKAVEQVRRQKHLGDLNPLPLVAIIANCLVWLVYGSLTQDLYVIMANEPGLMLGLYMTITAYGYADSRARELMLRSMLFFAGLISCTSVSIALFVQPHAMRVLAAGYQAVGVLLIYYAAPLSALAEVLRTRSSATLYWPLSCMSCMNGLFWVAYGLAVHDRFIWGPNAVGAFFGVIQLLLLGIFPSKPSRRSLGGGLDDEHSARAPLRGASAAGDDA